jgi:hypothetical protein
LPYFSSRRSSERHLIVHETKIGRHERNRDPQRQRRRHRYHFPEDSTIAVFRLLNVHNVFYLQYVITRRSSAVANGRCLAESRIFFVELRCNRV